MKTEFTQTRIKQMTRASTPKYQVVHSEGLIVLSGVSKTEASRFAKDMDKGSKTKRFSVRPIKKIQVKDWKPTKELIPDVEWYNQ